MLEKPEKCPQEVYEIMLKCWSREPDSRPNFLEIIHELEEIILKEQQKSPGKFKEHLYWFSGQTSGNVKSYDKAPALLPPLRETEEIK